jgi:hypothetical protein
VTLRLASEQGCEHEAHRGRGAAGQAARRSPAQGLSQSPGPGESRPGCQGPGLSLFSRQDAESFRVKFKLCHAGETNLNLKATQNHDHHCEQARGIKWDFPNIPCKTSTHSSPGSHSLVPSAMDIFNRTPSHTRPDPCRATGQRHENVDHNVQIRCFDPITRDRTLTRTLGLGPGCCGHHTQAGNSGLMCSHGHGATGRHGDRHESP